MASAQAWIGVVMRLQLCVASCCLGFSCSSVAVGDLSPFGDRLDAVRDTSVVDYHANDAVIIQARAQFLQKNYGKAYTLYKRATNLVPNDAKAWLGFAAACDMLGRFDRATRAYSKLAVMIGNRQEYHNNLGYSYMLRGKLIQARRSFLRAAEIDPKNATTLNNLRLLRDSVRGPRRASNQTQGI